MLYRTNASRAAFSLVEMVLALGIVSFAMVSLMGLLSLGLKTSREAIDETLQSQIMQAVRSQILLSNYTNITTEWDGKTFYFDDQGLEITSTATNTSLFKAYVNVRDAVVLNNPLPSTNAVNVVVNISNKKSPAITNIYSLIVVNTGS